MALKFVLFCSLVVATLASRPRYSAPSAPPPRPRYSSPIPSPSYRSSESVEPANYNFEWAVQDSHSGNHFGQQESRNHDDTKGSYYVLLPDGRTQKVTYYVDGDSGFIAEVDYEGQARYDAPASRPRHGYN